MYPDVTNLFLYTKSIAFFFSGGDAGAAAGSAANLGAAIGIVLIRIFLSFSHQTTGVFL